MNKQKSPKAEIQHAQKEGLEKEIPPKLEKDIEALSREITRKLSIEQHYSGPLPDGENIRIYNDVIPNKPSDRDGKNSAGQWFGFITAIAFAIIAWDLAKEGQAAVASILGGVDLVALVAVFIKICHPHLARSAL
ncbi:MAG: hypothetical protein V6Z82_05115 [Flavobacteriales bacterium]